MVDAYKRLPAPPGIQAKLETTMVIEVEETHAPEIDYSSVKEFLKRRPLPKMVGQKKVAKNRKSALVLDFSSVRELIPPALPRVSTTYICRENVTVANEWHLMLLQLEGLSCGLGILFYVPGTDIWSFVDVFVPGSHPQSALPGDFFELPLDLVSWQIFDFFTRRVGNHTPDTKEGFAPFSLSCSDEILAKLLSGLFLDLGLPPERQIGTSRQNQIPMKYREQIVTLANKGATRVPVNSFKTMLTCASCFGLFACIDTNLSLCSLCSKTCEGYKRNSGDTLPNFEYLQGKEANSRRNSKGSSSIARGIHRLAIGHLPQSFHFARKRNTELAGSGGQSDLRRARKLRTKLRNDPLVFSGSSR